MATEKNTFNVPVFEKGISILQLQCFEGNPKLTLNSFN